MAHKTEQAAVADVERQQDVDYGAIIAWKKDWDRWASAMRDAISTDVYDLVDPPKARTKNQLIFALKKGTTL